MAKIKIKTTGHATESATPTGAAGHRPIRRQRPAGTSPGAVVFAVFGWLAALVLVVLAVADARATRAKIQQLADSRPDRVKEIQQDMQTRLDAIAAKKKTATDEYNEKIDLQGKLDFDIKTLKLTLAELEPQAKSAERTHKKLDESVTALKSDTSLTTESVDDLKTKLAALEKTIVALSATYKRQEEAMRAEVTARIERPDPGFLKQWYSTHTYSVFGPAAGVFAAEKFYEKKRSQDALRLYEDVLRRYPDKANPYLDHCKTRIGQIEARTPYEPASIELERYSPLTETRAVPDVIH